MTQNPRVLAIGVALLLPVDVATRLIDLSRVLAGAGSDLVLDPEVAPPHVTLMMAGVRENRIAVLAQRLCYLFSRVPPVRLEPTGTTSLRTGSGRPTIWLNFDGRTLRSLHDAVADVVCGVAEDAAAAASLCFGGKAPVGDSTRRWVYDFARNATRAQFRPHVTLGRGDSAPEVPIDPFDAGRAVLARIGAHGTIPEILETFAFAPPKTS